MPTTSVPRRTRGTRAAMAASSVHTSCTGPLVSSWLGMKWSATQRPSQPVRSTCSQRPSKSSHFVAEPGHALNCISFLPAVAARTVHDPARILAHVRRPPPDSQPPPADHPLLELDQVVLTRHDAGATPEGRGVLWRLRYGLGSELSRTLLLQRGYDVAHSRQSAQTG